MAIFRFLKNKNPLVPESVYERLSKAIGAQGTPEEWKSSSSPSIPKSTISSPTSESTTLSLTSYEAGQEFIRKKLKQGKQRLSSPVSSSALNETLG